MKTSSAPVLSNRLLLALAFILFVLFRVKFFYFGAGILFSGDERRGIAESIDNSFFTLLLHGPKGELNRSPLIYLVDHVLTFSIFSGAPQKHWSVFLLYRLLPGTYWCAACAAIFFFSARFLVVQVRGISSRLALACAAAISIVCFSDPLMAYLSVQDRPYAPLLALSICHMLLFAGRLSTEKSSLAWRIAYSVCGLLMVYTAYVSVLLLGAAGAALAWKGWTRRDSQSLVRHAVFLVVAGGIALNFLVQVIPGFSEAPLRMGAILLQMLWTASSIWPRSTLAYSSYAQDLLTDGLWPPAGFLYLFPIALSLLGTLYWLREPRFRPFFLFVGLLGAGLACVKVMLTLRGHAMPGIRYIIFLYPTAYAFTLLACAAGARIFARFLPDPEWTGLVLLAAYLPFFLLVHVEDMKGYFRTPSPTKLWFAEAKPGCPGFIGDYRIDDNIVDVLRLRATCEPE